MTPRFRLLTSLAFLLLAPCLAAADDWAPKDPPMLTRWAADIDPAQPLPEYPRPQLVRSDWKNLNGLWDYAVVGQDGPAPSTWDGQILVPYPIESALSGVRRELKPDQTLYYQRTFATPAGWQGRRILLHFGAVDYQAEVFVNGKSVGEHEGGYTPFSFDITDALRASGEQRLTVKVTDPTWTKGQPRGKQTLSPAGIMYTPTSGIWQTVWLEPVAEGGVADLRIVPDVKGQSVEVTVGLLNDASGGVEIRVGDAPAVVGKAGKPVTIPVSDAKLWTPDTPHLYDLTVNVIQNGKSIDQVDSYFGMRSIEMAQVDGQQKLLLNGKPVFMLGPLDQGFWPDGCYTAPTDAALRYDLEVTKQMGFNTTRKHIKVEPARWYYHADQLGLMVWQDMPSANSYDSPPGGKPPVDRRAYKQQLGEMIDALSNYPSIVMWVVFNESQGKHDNAELVEMVRRRDPSRLVNEDSGFQGHGGPYQGVGDLYDLHPYPAPRAYEPPAGKAFVLGEYGGIGLKQGDNNPWQTKGWGYTNTQTSAELEDLYANYAGQLKQLRDERGLNAAIYTQITDVEIEINGLLTYDRKLKVDPELIAMANRFEWSGSTYEPIVATSEEQTHPCVYTFRKPRPDWTQPDARLRGWKNGQTGLGAKDSPGIGKIGAEWTTPDVWFRRTFDLPELSEEQLGRLALRIYHDDDVEVFVNGVPAFRQSGFQPNYFEAPLTPEAREALVLGGENVLAVHCHQGYGGQYVDVGLGLVDDTRPATTNRGEQVGRRFKREVTKVDQLDYLEFLPRDYDANRQQGWPLMLFLHGAGERGADLERVKVHGPPKHAESDPDFPFVLISPQCPEHETWDVDALAALLDEVCESHNIDLNRVYLTGLSMGGFGTWRLGLAHPERFAAIAPICGGGDRLAALLAPPQKHERLRSLPVWAFHGGKDPVVPLEESERMIDALQRLGAKSVQLTVYPKAGHDSWTETYANPKFYDWLLSQELNQ